MQFSDDEEKEHDKKRKQKDDQLTQLSQRQSIDAGNNTRPSSNEENVEDKGTKKDKIIKESNYRNPDAIPHFEDSFSTPNGSNEEVHEDNEKKLAT